MGTASITETAFSDKPPKSHARSKAQQQEQEDEDAAAAHMHADDFAEDSAMTSYGGMPEPVVRHRTNSAAASASPLPQEDDGEAGYLDFEEGDARAAASAPRAAGGKAVHRHTSKTVAYESNLDFDNDGLARPFGGLGGVDDAYLSVDEPQPMSRPTRAPPKPPVATDASYLQFEEPIPMQELSSKQAAPDIAETALDESYLQLGASGAMATSSAPAEADESYLQLETSFSAAKAPATLPADESYLSFEASAATPARPAAPAGDESYLSFEAPMSPTAAAAAGYKSGGIADSSYLVLQEEPKGKKKGSKKEKNKQKKGRTADTDNAYLDVVLGGVGGRSDDVISEYGMPPPVPALAETSLVADDGPAFEFDAEAALREAGLTADDMEPFMDFDAEQAMRDAGMDDDDGQSPVKTEGYLDVDAAVTPEAENEGHATTSF